MNYLVSLPDHVARRLPGDLKKRRAAVTREWKKECRRREAISLRHIAKFLAASGFEFSSGALSQRRRINGQG